MAKLVSLGLVASFIAAAGGAFAADGPRGQAIPDFAPNEKTGWILTATWGWTICCRRQPAAPDP